MPSTMARDSLGRIVRLGDVTDEGLEVGAFVGGELLLSNGCVAYRLPANLFTVDLDASPARTNYERYFADLGTHEEVVVAFQDINCHAEGMSCLECPFELIVGDCHWFDDWLDERAAL